MPTSSVSESLWKPAFRLTNTRMKDKYVLSFIYNFKATTETIASLLSRTLYGKRFFPYYTFNLLAGLDENGNGKVYGYDAVGSFDTVNYGV